MRYIKGLTKDTAKLLKRIYKQSRRYSAVRRRSLLRLRQYHQVRQRAHCILLSYQKYKISELMAI